MAMWEVFTGRRPFDHRSLDVIILRDIINQFRHPRPRGAVEALGLSDEVWGLMAQIWNQDPTQRPTMQEIANFLTDLQYDTPIQSQQGSAHRLESNRAAYSSSVLSGSDAQSIFSISSSAGSFQTTLTSPSTSDHHSRQDPS